MKNFSRSALAALGVLFLIAAPAVGQTTTYYMHVENSTELCCLQLRTAAPDSASMTYQSADLKNQPPQVVYLRSFLTQPGIPGVAGTIPSGSTFTARLWMRKTAAFGVVRPRAEFGFNGFPNTIPLCTATGTTGTAGPPPIPDQQLTTTIIPYEFSCQTTSPVTVTARHKFKT